MDKKETRQKWTEEEDKFLREHYDEMRLDELALALNRKYNSVVTRTRLLGLQKNRRGCSTYNRWTEEEDLFIARHWQTMKTSEMAKKLKRTKFAVSTRRRDLGFKVSELKADPYKYRHINEERIFAHLCWSCKYSCNGWTSPTQERLHKDQIGWCSWADHLVPVDGWEIKDRANVKHKNEENAKLRKIKFDVVKCPLYESDGQESRRASRR